MAWSAAYVQYATVVNVYVVGALCAFGIAGNVLSIVVLGRDRTIRRTTAFLLQMLAVADASLLVLCLFYVTLKTSLKFTDWLPAAVRRRWPYVRVYSYPMACISWTATVWMVVLLTADRYVAICRPIHAAQYSTMPRLRRAVAVVWVLAVAYSLPRFFETEVVEVETGHVSPSDVLDHSDANYSTPAADADMNVTRNNASSESRSVLKLQITAMYKSGLYQVVYKVSLDFVVRFFLPFAALAFFNQRLVRALRESDQIRRRSSTDGGGTERQHTWMLAVVVVVFVVCQLPSVVFDVCVVLHVYAGVPFSRRALRYAAVAVNLMLVVNSSVNVVIYCFMGRQFRTILLRIIACGASSAAAASVPTRDVTRRWIRSVARSLCTTYRLHIHPSSPGQDEKVRRRIRARVLLLDAVVDVHREMTFEADLDTLGAGRASTSRGDVAENSQDK